MKSKEIEIQDLSKILNLVKNENPIGRVLLISSFLEEKLKEILKVFLIKNKGTTKLLGSVNFYNTVQLCYSLGLIDESEYDRIENIRSIRNEFSHNWNELNFESNNIKKICKNFEWKGPSEDTERNSSKIFDFAVTQLLLDLTWRKRNVEKNPLFLKTFKNKNIKV